MNKAEFMSYMAEANNLTQAAAKKNIDIFTSSIIGALSEGNEVNLIGFGQFSISKRGAQKGRNPKTGAAIQIKAYNQPKFKAGQTLKNAVNK